MTQPSLLDHLDVCENRHRGSPESIAAHDRVVSTKREIHERILKAVKQRGSLTSHEIVRATGIPLQTVSARCSELKMVGKLIKTGERRNGAAVLRAA